MPLLLAEIFALILLLFSILVTQIFNVHFYFPDFNTILFIWEHYLGPLLLAVIIPIILCWFKKNETPASREQKIYLFRLFIVFNIIIFIHFNFKLWSSLINPINYDNYYHNFDGRYLFWIESLFLYLHKILNFEWLAKFNAYHVIFVSLFVVSFIISVINKNKMVVINLITATILVLGLGGVLYDFTPAIGPFIFCSQYDCQPSTTQKDMLDFHIKFKNSNGNDYSRHNFIMGSAAMPSLHIANSLVFLFYAFRYFRKHYKIIFLILFCFLMIEAVALRWHYVIDIIPGVVLAGLSIYLAEKYSVIQFGHKKIDLN